MHIKELVYHFKVETKTKIGNVLNKCSLSDRGVGNSMAPNSHKEGISKRPLTLLNRRILIERGTSAGLGYS